jgi:pimeloyl-ACP methyl ester carboxylesterase
MKAALLFALALAGAPAFAADSPPPANRYAATIVPAERFEAGTLLVERHGQRGTPLILVPGLGSGAWVWQDTIRQFSADHVVYVVTLPGFDGRKPAAGKMLDGAQQSLRQLIVSRKLDRPVVIGHSIGAVIAMTLAAHDSRLLRGVVAIDGLPVFPGTEMAPADQRSALAAGFKARMPVSDPQAFALQQQQYMRGIGVTDMARADELAKLSARSDPGAMLTAMGEAVELDLRPALPGIAVPVLLVAPYFEPDSSQFGMTREAKTAYYTSLMAGTPKLKVVSIEAARHFVMIDQPQKLADAMRDFLKSL